MQLTLFASLTLLCSSALAAPAQRRNGASILGVGASEYYTRVEN